MESGSGDEVRVALVDDHPTFRDALAALLEDHGFVVVAHAQSANEALALAHTTSIDVTVVDVVMRPTSGVQLTEELARLRPSWRILGLSGRGEPGLIADMLKAGAIGFALKLQPASEIIEALHAVACGQRYLPPAADRERIAMELTTAPTNPLQVLTAREREVFARVIRGSSNDEIATALFLSPRTVETHRLRLTNKLNTRTLLELQRLAARYALDD